MLFLYCLVLREANKCNAQKSCGANCIRVKFTLRKSYLLINLKLFLVDLKGFCTSDVCFAIQIIMLPFYFFCSPIILVHAQFHTQMLMCCQSAAVFVLQVGQRISAAVLPVLRVWHPVIHQEHVSSKKAKPIQGGVPLQSRNPQGWMYLKIPVWICEQWGQ